MKTILNREKALNIFKHNHRSQEEINLFIDRWQSLNDAVSPIIEKIHSVSKNSDLSPSGKQRRTAELQEGAVEAVASVNIATELAEFGDRLKADSLNRSVQIMDKHLPEDKMQLALDRQLILSALPAQESKALSAHQEILDTAERESVLLTDRQREFESPTITKLFEAVDEGVNGNNAVFIDTCFRAPYPVQMAPDDVLAEAQVRLEKSTSPELAAAIEANSFQQKAYAVLIQEAGNLIENPLKAVIPAGDAMMDSIKSKVAG